MNFFKNIGIRQRIQMVVVSLLIFLYATSVVTIYVLSSNRLLNNTHKQMDVFLNRTTDLIVEVEKQTGTGFSYQDYITLKSYFNQSAYYTTDFPFLIDANGNYLIHMFKEGQKYPKENLNRMYAASEKKGGFETVEYRNNQKHRIVTYFKRIEPYNAFLVINVNLTEVNQDLNQNRLYLLLLVVICGVVFVVTVNYFLRHIVSSISKVSESLLKMAKGEPGDKLQHPFNDEVGRIVTSLNQLIDGLERTGTFATEIGKNNLATHFDPLGKNDVLGNALLTMRESLKQAALEEAKRNEEETKRHWINSGLAKFGDILRQNNSNLHLLADSVTQNLIDYLNANQGGLFLLNDDQDQEKYLELISAFAYNRKKFKKKTILLGEGLVGNCAIERNTIHLREIPEDYIEITSGLGDAPPRTLLIVPLKLEEKVFGVIEIASFNDFHDYEVEFVEQIGETIASTLSAVKNNIRTKQLLEQSQQQSEEMAAQEEEMRQNMEEMLATQEEMARKTLEMEGMTSAINEALLFAELNENGSFLFANNNLISATGYSKYDLEEIAFANLIHPDNLASFKTAWGEVRSGNPFTGVLHWRTHLEEDLYILSSITPSFDESGSLYKVFLLGQDVTESKSIEMKVQRQAEEVEAALQEIEQEQQLAKTREEDMRALLLALDQTCLVSEFTPQGMITYINSKNIETLGDSKETIEGKYHKEIDFQAKTDPVGYKQMWSNLQQGIPQKREFNLNVKGRSIWISEHYTPVTNNEGEIFKVINIGIDISESKENEERLLRLIDSFKQQQGK